MSERTYTVLCPFGGIGGGALGFLQAEVRLLGVTAKFRCLGGIDFDANACADFEMLTGSKSLCADVGALTIDQLRMEFGVAAPDVVFLSPPCKGASGLLSKEKANTSKYRKMNRLALDWVKLMLKAWPTPPRLVLLENVPRLKTRAKHMLKAIRSLLHKAGYVFSDGYHCCGEIGGLAERRRRYLLVARHKERVPPLLYQPPKRRVRACGEVLGPLPMPGDAAAGPMHVLPKLSWLNWVRLALIPAGGDWRDLEGVLRDGQPRREVWKRHKVQDWEQPTDTVAGSGSNGPGAVADPRVSSGCKPGAHESKLRVEDWGEPVHTVTGSTRVGSGAPSVADPRLPFGGGRLGVTDWSHPVATVTGESYPSNGSSSVADPRAKKWFDDVLRVIPWDKSTGAVTSSGGVTSNGALAVADPRIDSLRIKTGFDHGYGVLSWNEPSPTVTAGSHPGQGAYSVADLRFKGEYHRGYFGVIGWEEAAGTITGNARVMTGRFAVSDPRKPPPFIPVIIAADGTWHRPLTTLELAVLQGFPPELNGKPLTLSGTSVSGWRERIGNAVPPPTARAIAEQMLVTLVHADFNSFVLSGTHEVWVEPERASLQ